jgi:hypothetical protein
MAGAQGRRATGGQAAGRPGPHPDARFAAEREFSRPTDAEDVVPGGESRQSVKRTPSCYFSDVQDLATAGPQRRAIAIS